LIDCELLSKVYINLTDQKEPSLNFNVDENKEKQIIVNNVSYYKKIIHPTEDEIKNHKNYLKNNLKKNFF
jgi:DNA polymerase-3 subunit epsilon